MNDTLIKIFKKVVNGDTTVRSDVVDYLVENGGPGPAHAGDDGDCEFNKDVTIQLDGNYNLNSEVYCTIACLLAKGLKIQAIKTLRANTGYGLKESKESVDNLKNWNIIPD